MSSQNKINLAFFGSSRFSVIVLDELEKVGYLPAVIVTTPDKPKGRNLVLTPTPVKEWAYKRNIPVIDAEKLDANFSQKISLGFDKKLNQSAWDLFIVASYGKIIPQVVIDIPKHKTLNVHPSLLPKYRGASPLQSAILDDDKKTGVTIMQIDAQMDHGPIVAQEEVNISDWPKYAEFEKIMAEKGGQLLAKIIPQYLSGQIKIQEQDHRQATNSRKINKEDGLINFKDEAYLNFRKIQAFNEWPQAYFMHNHRGKKVRVKISQARFEAGQLVIEKVIPEGAKEISLADFWRGYGPIADYK